MVGGEGGRTRRLSRPGQAQRPWVSASRLRTPASPLASELTALSSAL